MIISFDSLLLGVICITVDDDGVISALTFGDEPSGGSDCTGQPPYGPMSDIERDIHTYLAGRLVEIRLPFRAHGTPFQEAVWEELRRIRYGTVATYGQIAARIGRPRAARAVGNACGTNPVPLLIPCHRALPAGGGLGGFMSGVWRKRVLIVIEKKL